MQRSIRFWQRARWPFRLGLAAALVIGSGLGARAIITNLVLVSVLHQPKAEHLDQNEVLALIQNNQTEEAFDDAFEHGDELFQTVFNALDGVGANVGHGERFTRVPRADLTGPGEWANHVPSRATGPNAQACNECHSQKGDDGSGPAAANVHRDPQHSADLKHFIQRNTPHLFGAGAVQRLAEEMTTRLFAIRSSVSAAACAGPLGNTQSANLTTKGVNFGVIRAQRVSRGGTPCPNAFSRRFVLNLAGVRGVETDLVVRPFQWKGNVAFIRNFNRDASHNELGMQPVELVGDGVDGDFDGVVDELGIGDETALAVYVSAQPRPVTTTELASLGLAPPQSPSELAAIADGANQFRAAACDTCHKPSLTLNDPIFSEPSQNPSYRDASFPAGQNPVARGVDPAFPITYDLTTDILENQVTVGGQVIHLGNHVPDGNGGAIISLFGDLKRHDMGPGLAEQIDEVGTGASTFLTENLWGVGSTAPYLHDGRATTLTEAILEHDGEAAQSRANFVALSSVSQSNLIAFLSDLVLFKQE
jgi:cytochrome c553